MLEANYLKESVFKDYGEEAIRKRDKLTLILEDHKLLRKIEPFNWDWLCLDFKPYNVDKQHLENLKRQQVR